jgi:hypothetical protein
MSLTNQVANVYSSWGRTRQPKNIAGGHKKEIVVHPSGYAALTASADTEGYPTQNQQYLHVYISGSTSSNKDLDAYGYIYAFGQWVPLLDAAGGSVTMQANGTGDHYKVFKLAGCDRIAFKDPNSAGADKILDADLVMVAMSTFIGNT